MTQPTRDDKRDDKLGLNPGEFPSIQEQLESAWEHAFEADETLDDDPDDYDDGGGFVDDVDISDYTAGYENGFAAGMVRNSIHVRLRLFLFPYPLRSKYYALRRRLFPHNNDIPF